MMQIALNEYKTDRERGVFCPGERRSTTGLFTGDDGRLVYIDRGGPIRDYSDGALGLTGIKRSRLGISVDGDVTWLDELDTVRQEYEGSTTVVVTEHDAGAFTVYQYDYTLEHAHLTHIELRGDTPDNPDLVAALTFAPDGEHHSTGQLVHDDVVEVFHEREHDYVTTSTGLGAAVGQQREGFEELLSSTPQPYPGETSGSDALSDTVVITAPLDSEGEVRQGTLVSLLTDRDDTDRADALAHVRAFADHYQTDNQIRIRASSHERPSVPDISHRETIENDLRVLSLLTAPTGARLKGPECDPYHVYSGGYGYTWFRDDAEIGRHLLRLQDVFELDCADQHAKTASLYCQTQLPDGTWPQRVWAHNGALAPGWAHDRVTGSGVAFQADASASALAFLATYLRVGAPEPEEATRIESTIEKAIEGLASILDSDGLPGACQSLWEDEIGRFTHTAGTFLEAFAAVARSPVEGSLANEAMSYAETLYEALGRRWDPSAGFYVRAPDDERLDIGTLALVSAHREYANAGGTIGMERLGRLDRHLRNTVSGLERSGEGDLWGLARYEGDSWRRDSQSAEKIWPLATGWAALSSVDLGCLVSEQSPDATEGEQAVDIDSDEQFDRARKLLTELLPGGSLVQPTGYLSEQVFDDGTGDSVTPFGWCHAIRSGTVAKLAEAGELGVDTESTQPTGPAGSSTWTTGKKYGVGTACDHGREDPSRVWFTLGEGSLTEPRFPRADLLNFRTVDFLVVDADGDSTYTARTHNERQTDDELETIERRTTMVATEGPVYRQRIVETGTNGHEWELVVEYVTDPESESILLDINFTATDGKQYDLYVVGDTALSGYMNGTRASRVEDGSRYALTAVDTGAASDPAVVDEDGSPYEIGAALASKRQFDWATVEHAGSSRLQQLFEDGTVTSGQATVAEGHAILVGRVGTTVSSVADTLSLGFAENDAERALEEARDSLDRGYVSVRESYLSGWKRYLEQFELPDSVTGSAALTNQYYAALIVLKAVEDKTFHGAGLASPSVPWGEAVDATEPRDFGYNFAWARDLYQVFSALRVIGDIESARDSLEYIYEYQQRTNGFLPQNTYLDGRTRWGGEQLDNIAFPSVMAYQLSETAGLEFSDVTYDYGNVRGSVEYLLRSGPHSGQERWEEEAGYSPSTIAAEIAGLACGAPLAAKAGEPGDSLVYLAHADAWRDGVEQWCATKQGTDRHDQTPYYVRVTRNGEPDSGTRRELANNGPTLDERDIIDAGFLELVRLGIKQPDETIIENSVSVVDETIRVETPHGPAWYRYNGDGYGELGETEAREGGPWGVGENGSGRLWPIFTGERAEYELLSDSSEDLDPQAMLETMAEFANSGRMIPEQVWDREYPTEFGLEFGEGTGAATPLAWSMAQFVRLAHSIDAGSPVEMPAFIANRYDGGAPERPSLAVDDVVHRKQSAEPESGGEKTKPETQPDVSEIVITGETDGGQVAAWTPSETVHTAVDGDRFELVIPVEPDIDEVRVVAGTAAEELVGVGTALEYVSVPEASRDGDND